MECYLPSHCYRNKELKITAIVIHYFSCIYVQPKNPYDLRDCWMLMNDLNLPRNNRIQFLKAVKSPPRRMYAAAHCFIGRKGELHLTVPEDRQAYHAGKSYYKGKSNWNVFSYGIELVGSARSKFTDEQYKTCAEHCQMLMKANPKITLDWIVGHETVSPGRKKDPGIATGNFDMERLKLMIQEIL